MTIDASLAPALALLLGAAGLMLVPDRVRLPAPGETVERPPASVGPVRRAVLWTVMLGVVGITLAPRWWWLIMPAATAVGVLLGRSQVGTSSPQRGADRGLVAVYAELLASCLDAGMAVAPAMRAVATVLGRPPSSSGSATSPPTDQSGPLAILNSVAAMLSLGADPRIAWRPADLDELVAPLAAAARRSAAGGSGLAAAVREHAAQLRQESVAASARSAGRAGVLMTAPLGICFLPAFLCLGLAPVVVGLLGQLQIF